MADLSKFTKHYKAEKGKSSPQGEGTLEFIARKNGDLLSYVINNAEKNSAKKQDSGKPKALTGFEIPPSGGLDIGSLLSMFSSGLPTESASISNFNSVVTPPGTIPISKEPFDSSILKPSPNGTTIETTGKEGNFYESEDSPYGVYSKSADDVPDYVKDVKSLADSKGLTQAKPALNLLQGLPSLSMLFPEMLTSIGKTYNENENIRKQKWLDKNMAVENVVTPTYGTKGDYDINSGNFRPDKMYGKFKKGGEANKKELPEAFAGALISLLPMIMNMHQQNKASKQAEIQQNRMIDFQKQQEYDNKRLQIVSGIQNVAPQFKKGGMKSYEKGGAYEVDDKEISRLIKEGYKIEFQD